MNNFVGEIEPNAYNIEYNEAKKQVVVKLSFTID